jgi:hypothetical protein
MKNKIIINCMMVILIAIASIIIVNAQETTACCEKTLYGAWCQDAKPESCDTAFRRTPTSCDATSFCKLGCCYDSQEGICLENTPQLVCQQNNGTWADSAKCEIPQCNLGCCIFGNQAAFVTLVRCKRLSNFFGIQTNFRTDVKTEPACIALAYAQERGACVFEENFVKTCRFITRGECDAMQAKRTSNSTGNVSFYKDYLCSAEELGTNCGPTRKTMCIEGKDEVYFQDSCGNPSNIYDSSRITDKAYWKKVIEKKDACGFGNSNANANSASCGNCDYFAGSFCRQYDKSKDARRPSYGDYICRDLNCKNTQDGKDYRHGESWCVYDDGTGLGEDPVGSRQWKHICVAGEEIVEPCGDLRSEVCIQDVIKTDKGEFQQAGCRVNRWQDCVAQKKKEDCENIDKRDCQWIEKAIGSSILTGLVQAPNNTKSNFPQPNQVTSPGITGAQIFGGSSDSSDTTTKTPIGSVCVPDVPPGLKFWESGEAQGICQMGSASCTVDMEKSGFLGGGEPKPVKNGECLEEEWNKTNMQICKSLGDCTGSVGVYTYLEKGGFGVSGTGMKKTITEFFLPLAELGDWFIGLSTARASDTNSTLKGGIGK